MLLKTTSVPQAEFACLSILMDDSSLDVEPFVELHTVVSPLATTPPVAVRSSLLELHNHVNQKKMKINGRNSGSTDHQFNGTSNSDRRSPLQAQHEALMNGLAMEAEAEMQMQMNDNEHLQQLESICVMEEDRFELKRRRARSQQQRSMSHSHASTRCARNFDEYYSYRTRKGMVLEYAIVRDKDLIRKCICAFNPMGHMGIDLPFNAIVITIGLTGAPYQTNFSSNLYILRDRLKEFVELMEGLRETVPKDAKQMMNKKQDLELMLLSLLMDDECLLTNTQFDVQNGNHIDNTAEMIVNQKDQSKSKLFPKKLKFAEKRRRKKEHAKEAAAIPDVSTTLLSSTAPSSEIAKIVSDQMQVLSLAENHMNMTGYRDNNAGAKSEIGKADRDRASGGIKSPTRSNRRIGREMAGFDYVPPLANNTFSLVSTDSVTGSFISSSFSDTTSVTATTISTDSSASGSVPTLSGPSRDSSSMKRTLRRNKVAAASLANQRSHAWNAAVSMENGGIGQSPQKMKSFDPFSEDGVTPAKTAKISSPKPAWEESSPSPSSYVPGSRKLFIVMALNEDLACTYRGSKITSCAIQGIVQLQMKSNSTAFVPFIVNVRDDDGHIKNIEANSDVANDLTHEEGDASSGEYKFVVTLPKAEDYHPVLKYSCSNALVPVPLRVQSKVRTNGMNCRVALQVSSNPSNEKRLTELSIIMILPDNALGESVNTQPQGGIWDEKKRSLNWCVKELAPGNKFMLQVQFSLLKAFEGKPSFPITVRCQSMSAQLSSVVMDCSDAKGFPGEISSKLARRFRVSHRELEY